MHTWGDETVDWAGIDDAASFIARRLLFWRVDVRQWKEKWGEVRIYCSLGIQWWPQLTHPGHVYNRWPKWMNWLAYGSYRGPLSWPLWALNLIMVPFHKWLYISTYAAARRRWPHLAQEIYRGADYHELLGSQVTDHLIWWPEWDQAPAPCVKCSRINTGNCWYCEEEEADLDVPK